MAPMPLCRRVGIAPLGQLRAWLTLNGCPQGQCEASLVGVQPYLRQNASQKACLCSWKPYLASGMLVSQDDAPFSLACSIPLCWGVDSLDFRVLAFVTVSERLLV